MQLRLVGCRDAVLFIENTTMLTKDKRSVDVASQYYAAPGKVANC